MKSLTIFFIILLLVIGYLIFDKFSYPVTYKVCDLSFSDCTDIAKFKERDDCEFTKEKWGWYCDETKGNPIICEKKTSMIATGYCE